MRVIVSAGRYTDRTLATASWYDVHELTPGEYPLEPVDGNWKPMPAGQRPYYYLARVPTTLVEEYRVNQVFTASSSQTKHPNQPDRLSVLLYPFEAKPGKRVLDGYGEIVEG